MGDFLSAMVSLNIDQISLEADMHRSYLMLACGCSILVLAVFACSSPLNFGNQDQPAESELWQAAVDDLRVMTQEQQIPQHLIDPEKPAGEAVFDPNHLLVPLTHLRLRPGYTLDFVYRFDGMGGRPFLYAREETAPPFGDYDAFQAAVDACHDSMAVDRCDYLDYIEADGTAEGFFQWVVLKTMGDQFYLFWHAGYHDAEIIASRERLDSVVADLASGNFGVPLSAAQRRQALRVDPAPVVTLGEDAVTVRVIWFTRWGGFNETTYTLSRSAPYRVIGQETNQLVDYDCGIMF